MDNVENEDWSFIDSYSNHSDWSVVTHDRGSKSYNSGSQSFSIVDDGESSLSTIQTSPSLVWSSQMSLPTVMEDYPTELHDYDYDNDDDDANDLRLPEGKMKSKRTSGKRLLKHSLQKRYNGSRTPNDDRIEVCRPRLNQDLPSPSETPGYYPKTIVDDVLPSLLEVRFGLYGWPIPTSLGRKQRWKTIRELFEELEDQNFAVRVDPRAATDNRKRGGDDRGRWSDAPTDVVSYSVQPNGQYIPRERTRRLHHTSYDTCVFERSWGNGRFKALYKLSSEIPGLINKGHLLRAPLKPLKASIHLNPDTKIDNQREARTQKERIRQNCRRAFVPGVAKVCKANSTNLLRNAQKNVASHSVDLVFGRAVRVAYVSVAGKVHDTKVECFAASKGEDYRPRTSTKTLEHNKKTGRDLGVKWIHIAVPDSDAYCDKVEISVRLTTNPRRWVSLGVFDACRDGHTETPIYLGRSEVASHHDQSVSCIAIKFRAVSWHNKPLLRVGAYGFELGSKTERMLKKASKKNNKHQDTGTSHQDGNVIYTLYRMKGEASDDIGKAKYSVQQKYAIKEGVNYKSYDKEWYDKGFHAQRKKRPIRSEIKEALKS